MQIDDAVAECQKEMEEASKMVLSGFAVRTEAKVVRYPERYEDRRGVAMWNAVSELVGGIRG